MLAGGLVITQRQPQITLSGTTTPEATVTAVINGVTEAITSDKTGSFIILFYNAKEGLNEISIYAEKDGTRSREQSLFLPYFTGVTITSGLSGIVLDIPKQPPPSRVLCKKSPDLDSNGKINVVDLSIMLFRWHSTDCYADLNNDGMVGSSDFLIFMRNWSPLEL